MFVLIIFVVGLIFGIIALFMGYLLQALIIACMSFIVITIVRSIEYYYTKHAVVGDRVCRHCNSDNLRILSSTRLQVPIRFAGKFGERVMHIASRQLLKCNNCGAKFYFWDKVEPGILVTEASQKLIFSFGIMMFFIIMLLLYLFVPV